MTTSLPERGLSRDEITKTLADMRANDLSLNDGRAWGYVYDAGPDVAAIQKEAVTAFMSTNGLDPTMFPSLERLENEVLDWCTAHLNGNDDCVGSFTSGGTESCMLAIKAARDHAKATRGITEPEMLLPVTAHAAFHKGAHYFGVKIVPIPVDAETFEADVDAIAESITDNTVLIVGSAPGYAHGVIDPIEAIGAIAKERNILFHVDGCIGGFLLPLFEQLGEELPRFDFRVPGVTSISMDLHKYGFAPKGSSVLIHRDRSVRRAQYFACAGWTGYSVVNSTIQSTKSGGPLAGAWAVMRFLGQDGYLALARKMLDATKTLIEGVAAIEGLRILGTPQMGLIAMSSDVLDVFQLCDELGEKGWFVVPQLAFGNSPKNAHLMVDPANSAHADAFLADLRACVALCQERPIEPAPAPIAQLASALTPDMVQAQYKQLMAMAGAGDGLPKRRAQINQIIDALPSVTKEALLIEFISELYSKPQSETP